MRLFLAAPSDLADARQTVLQVVAEINDRVIVDEDRQIEVVDWNRVAEPLVKMPESVAFQQLDITEQDVFVGLTWLAFDTSEDRTDGGTVCTERDLELGYNYWKTQRRPRCFFFRSMQVPTSLAQIDSRQFDRVGLFYQRFSDPEKNPFVYQEYSAAEDLENRLRDELSELALQGAEAAKLGEVAHQVAPKADLRGETQFEQKMKPGKAYEVTFLSLAIQDWERLEQEDEGKLAILSKALLDQVKQTASTYGGEIFTWGLPGGLVMFWAKRNYDHAIMSSLKILHNLPVFNLDPEQNPLGTPIDLRASAHDAVIVFQLPIDDISSADIQFVVGLQKDYTHAGELTLTRRMLERIDDRLKPHFKFKGRWEREPVYSCQLPSSRREKRQVDVGDFVSQVREQSSLVRSFLEREGFDAEVIDALATAVDEAYSQLNKFCASFASINYDWPSEFLGQLAEASVQLRDEESLIWTELREKVSDSSLNRSVARRIEAMVQAAARRRSRPVVILEKLEQRCRSLAASGAEPALKKSEADEELLRSIDKLIGADDLDNETALTELLLHHKPAFMDYVRTHDGEERHTALLDKMWETADLALLDDLYSIRGHKRASDLSIFESLTHTRVKDPRFRIVQSLLASPAKPEEAIVAKRFEREGLRVTKPDLQVVWRCAVIGHESEEVRTFAAMQLNAHSMWMVVSHPNASVQTIYALGERMDKKEGEDAKKIFFDCTRSRIEQVVENFRTKEELEQITKLIMMLLGFGFLVETGYFERFDDILRKFLNNAQARGLKVEYFERLRRTLEAARQEAGDKGPSKPPAGIKSLPLPIQRRLAGEARYIYWFVTHPDQRIACETLRHIGLMHVERVLRLREINTTVLHAILRRHELFTRQQALISALNHPKCTQEFAARYIPGLARTRQGRQALDKIATNPSASPVVRSNAKRTMATVSRRRGA